MNLKHFIQLYSSLFIIPIVTDAQSVGIGTTTPHTASTLHVDIGANTTKGLLITGTYNANTGSVPDLGQGSRLMFYPGKSAFRAGSASTTSWNNNNVGIYSTAFGLGTTANGPGSFALGNFTVASGTLSLAAGSETKAIGTFSTSFGAGSSAQGAISTAMGYHSIAKGFASTIVGMYNDSILISDLNDDTSPNNPLFIVGNGTEAARSNAMVVMKHGAVGIGTNAPNATALLHVDAGSTSKYFVVSGQSSSNATAPNLGGGTRMMFFPGKSAFRAGRVFNDEWNNSNIGSASVAMGYSTIASDEYSFASGDRSKATGPTSTALGWRTEATAFAATAMGASNIASGQISTAMGYANVSRGFASTVVGTFNDPILATAQTDIASTTPLFIVGNGSSGALSNAMVVLKNGNVGIGTNAPENELVLNSTTPELELQQAGVSKGFMHLSGDNVRLGCYSSNPTGSLIVRLNGGDRFTVFPNGNATLSGTLTQNSDERLKENIAPINNALDKVTQLNGYEYNWKPGLQKDNAKQIGLIAQNVEKILPELVLTDKEGIKSVAYQNMVPVLIEAIKELQALVKDQQLDIRTQQQQIERLTQKLSTTK